MGSKSTRLNPSISRGLANFSETFPNFWGTIGELLGNFWGTAGLRDGKHDISADDINLSICEFFEKHRDKLDGFRQCLEEWAEMGRNELAVSLIEGMDDKELEKRMAAAENGEKNCLYQFEFEEETIDSGYVKYDET